jgi:hypothetical protein
MFFIARYPLSLTVRGTSKICPADGECSGPEN